MGFLSAASVEPPSSPRFGAAASGKRLPLLTPGPTMLLCVRASPPRRHSTPMPHLRTAVTLVACALGLCAAWDRYFSVSGGTAPDGREIARLVTQLGSEDFDEREAATARLKE